MINLVFSTILFILLFIGCGSYNDSPGKRIEIKDNLSLYSDRDHPQLIDFQLHIPTPNDFTCVPWNDRTAAPRPCTLEDVLHDDNPYDDYKPAVHVDVKSDTPIQYQGTGALSQKGKSTREAPQKSFRVKLDRDAPLYQGQRTLQLGKHPYDDSRVRNKLFFDLFVGLPHMLSLRTNFTKLFIDNDNFGLYTHVEKIDSHYLINHHLKNGKIYKAQNFTFRYSDDLALDENGEPLDPKAFEARIEPEKGRNYTKLVEMVKAVEYTPQNKFMDVFNTYFDYDNYVTWMAMNFVTCNTDTINQNFFLYNPDQSKKFVFIPWDYDGASWYSFDQIPKWQLGFGRYWDIPLHRKFLSIESNRKTVEQRIDEIYQNYINPDTVAHQLSLYRPIVEPLIKELPDSRYLKYTKWESDFNSLPQRIKQNIDEFRVQEGVPMPFWQSITYDRTLTVWWDKAIDFENDPVVYDLYVADNPAMKNPLISYTNLSPDQLQQPWEDQYKFDTEKSLASGIYYLKIIAKERDNPAHFQIAFDVTRDQNNSDIKYFGVLEFKIQ